MPLLDREHPHLVGDPPGKPYVRVLVNTNRDNRRSRFAVDLGEEDICDLRDHAVRMGEIGLGSKTVNCRQLGEIYLGRRFEGEILEPFIFALEIGLSLKAESIKAGKVLFPVLAALLP